MVLKVKHTLEVSLNMNDSKATVNLNEKDAAIREALEKLIAQIAASPERADDSESCNREPEP